MKPELSLFNGENPEELIPKKKPLKRAAKAKLKQDIYACFTIQEIMEFFDWGK